MILSEETTALVRIRPGAPVGRRTRTLGAWALIALVALIVPHQVPAQTGGEPDGGRPIVIGKSYVLPSRLLGEERRITVQVPESYSDASKRFPVLFLLDGGENEDFVHIAGLARINAAYGNGQELILVGIEGRDRRHDLTSPSQEPADLKAAPTSGGAALYRRFLVEELKPWIASRYRTSGRTGLIGESLAGLFVLETLLKAPASFDDYVVVSPSLWWNGGRLTAGAASDLGRGGFDGRRASITFETPSPPEAEAAKERARQSLLKSAFQSSAPPSLRWTVTHSPEGHATVYHPAAWAAFRHLYGPPQK